MGFSLVRDQRLQSKQQFDCVFSNRKRLYSPHFLAYYRDNELSYSRLGVIIAKRNVRLAVDRNRIRRILKEQFRHLLPTVRYTDIVFIAKKGINVIENRELSQCIRILLKKINRLPSVL